MKNEAAVVLGSIKTAKKAKSSAKNGTKGGRPKMIKYSLEWKIKQGAWVQDSTDCNCDKIWEIHYIANDTEYREGKYFTAKSANEALKEFKKVRP